MSPPPPPEKKDKVDVEVLKGLFGLGQSGLDGVMKVIEKLVDLAKTNPLWGGILGIIIVDLMTHNADFIKWTHTEIQWSNSTGSGLLTAFDQLTGAHFGEQQETVTIAGILSTNAGIEITALILASFAVSNAGAIISDITKITDLVGNQAPPAGVVQPSVTTLVESGAIGTGVVVNKS